jgi:protein-L-isoaspartate(D-aspartate) O-methyltransferase
MIATMMETLRQFYAEEICAVANVESGAMVNAFATVPRERFLGEGPWDVASFDPARGGLTYRKTRDADPRHVNHNVLVAIDSTRQLNNGQPSALAFWLDALKLGPGDAFVHIGCGIGYYTAVAAVLVGSSGRVVAVEIDSVLAARATDNLAPFSHVTVVAADGAACRPGPCDAILVNAGFTHPLPVWLESLKPGGRLVVPIVAVQQGSTVGSGGMLRVTREADRFRAEFISLVAIFASPSGRLDSLNDPIRQAFVTGAWQRVKTVRVDEHSQEERCCIHAEGICLSRL